MSAGGTGPEEFGHDTWACRRCQDQTHFRIEPGEIHFVPLDDCPESWGRREEWLAAVRAQRRREMRGTERLRDAVVRRAEEFAVGNHFVRALGIGLFPLLLGYLLYRADWALRSVPS